MKEHLSDICRVGESVSVVPMEMIPASGQYAIFDATTDDAIAVEAKQLICWTLAKVWIVTEYGRTDCGESIYGYVVDEDSPALIAAAEDARFVGYVYAANVVIAMRKGYEMVTGEPPPAADALARAQNQTFFTAPEE